MKMEWAEIRKMCQREAEESDLFFEADWANEQEALQFFERINLYDRGQVGRFLDAQITDERPSTIAARLISGLGDETESVLYHRIIFCDDNGDDGIGELFEKLFLVMTDVFRFPTCLWKIGGEAGVPLEKLFLQLPFWKYERFGSVFHNYYTNSEYEKKIFPIMQWKTGNDPRYDLIDVRRKELEIRWAITSGEEEKESAFLESALLFFNEFYKEDLYEDEDGQPDMLRHAIQIRYRLGGLHE